MRTGYKEQPKNAWKTKGLALPTVFAIDEFFHHNEDTKWAVEELERRELVGLFGPFLKMYPHLVRLFFFYQNVHKQYRFPNVLYTVLDGVCVQVTSSNIQQALDCEDSCPLEEGPYQDLHGDLSPEAIVNDMCEGHSGSDSQSTCLVHLPPQIIKIGPVSTLEGGAWYARATTPQPRAPTRCHAPTRARRPIDAPSRAPNDDVSRQDWLTHTSNRPWRLGASKDETGGHKDEHRRHYLKALYKIEKGYCVSVPDLIWAERDKLHKGLVVTQTQKSESWALPFPSLIAKLLLDQGFPIDTDEIVVDEPVGMYGKSCWIASVQSMLRTRTNRQPVPPPVPIPVEPAPAPFQVTSEQYEQLCQEVSGLRQDVIAYHTQSQQDFLEFRSQYQQDMLDLWSLLQAILDAQQRHPRLNSYGGIVL
ncbi:hypothetical protein HYC85_020116 [Camellia sinensis]|uniref:Uncharacterized protein n=1 Tax=Camellia sinensis TaxID=4442 RepID=A0A7J7GSQ2_CAMSI|nr:hypothetical protein HYC85_020116 [Camellia sinensis]